MQSSVNRDGFLPPDPDELVEEGELPFADAVAADTDDDLRILRSEIRLLQARIGLLTEDAEAALKAKATALDASAHVQLGDHPWLKLAAAMGATFVAARLIRSLPLGMMIAVLAGNLTEPRRY